MTPRVVAVDMDGTFLRPDMTYDRPRFARLRELMRARDVRFVVASGNQFWQLSSFFEPADDVAYAAENGHYLFDVGDAAPFAAPEPVPGLGREMVDLLEAERLSYLVSTPGGAFMPARVPAADEAWARLYYYRLDVVEDIRAVADRAVKATLRAEEPLGVAARLEAALGGRMAVAVSGPEDIDLNLPGHNKATGLARFLERWGVGWADVVAFGDNHNDLEMLRSAGTAVAMANARPAVLEAADRVAPPNTADGVLAVLEDLLG